MYPFSGNNKKKKRSTSGQLPPLKMKLKKQHLRCVLLFLIIICLFITEYKSNINESAFTIAISQTCLFTIFWSFFSNNEYEINEWLLLLSKIYIISGFTDFNVYLIKRLIIDSLKIEMFPISFYLFLLLSCAFILVNKEKKIIIKEHDV